MLYTLLDLSIGLKQKLEAAKQPHASSGKDRIIKSQVYECLEVWLPPYARPRYNIGIYISAGPIHVTSTHVVERL